MKALRRLGYVLSLPLMVVIGVLILVDYIERFAWWLVTGVDPEGCTWTWQATLALAKVPDYIQTGQWPAL